MYVHAVDWLDSWNRADLDGVLGPFADNARFVSPKAAAIMGSAVLEGKDKISTYWRTALKQIVFLEFTLDRVVCDTTAGEMLVVYNANLKSLLRNALTA